MLVVIGTSLAVFPFCMVVDFVPDTVPKVLINMENTNGQGYDFEDPYHYPNRLLLKGKSDEAIVDLCKEIGWYDELMKRVK